MLVDIVSKNGNLLINVVQRPDGSLDPEAEQVLAEMADWIAINGEAHLRAPGPGWSTAKARSGPRAATSGEDFAYTAKDIRFTTKGDKARSMPSSWAGRRTARSRSARWPSFPA